MSSATILIVGDESINLDGISAELQQGDYELLRAGSGGEAWAMLESDPDHFNAVILDYASPDRNGARLLDNIKKHASTERLPVVMQAGAAQQFGAELDADALCYLTRSFDGDSLKSVLRSAVGSRQREKSLQESLRAGRRIFELMSFGRFRIRDLDDVKLVALQVAQLCPDPERVVGGVSELLLNAIEHGNLNIGYAEKGRLMRSGRWQQELERRLAAAAETYVELEFEVNDDRVLIRVRDQGEGFDWRPYLDFDPARAFDPHGRGIAMARLSSFDSLKFLGKGNEVVARVTRQRVAWD